jgi:hypothetical protein
MSALYTVKLLLLGTHTIEVFIALPAGLLRLERELVEIQCPLFPDAC